MRRLRCRNCGCDFVWYAEGVSRSSIRTTGETKVSKGAKWTVQVKCEKCGHVWWTRNQTALRLRFDRAYGGSRKGQ